MNIYEVIRRPIVTEKGVDKKDDERTLCFEVAADANKTQIKAAVREAVQGEGGRSPDRELSTASCAAAAASPATARIGRRRTCKLKAGEKMPEYAEI